jgi:cytochrome c-type biogenesis protein CcmH
MSATLPEAAPSAAAPSRGLTAGIALFVLAVGLGGYAWKGDRAGMQVGPGEGVQAQASAADDATHTTDQAQIEAMVQRLADKLADRPDDVEGWSMLARSYSAIGRVDAAVPAFKHLVELQPKSAQALADYADALATQQRGQLTGEPERLINQALGLDAQNMKALALAGTLAFDRQQFPRAIELWERAVSVGGPQSPMTAQLQGALREAREGAGISQPAPTAAAATEAPTAVAAAARTGPSLQGQVSLAPELQRLVSPDDSVFVFARSPEGGKPPLAIQRYRASELPIRFSLDDRNGMGMGGRLSAAEQVVVGVRISKLGDAKAHPGDLQALSAPVKPGAQGLQLVINEIVK